MRNLKNPASSGRGEATAPEPAGPSDGARSFTLTRQDIAQAVSFICRGLSQREAKRLVDGVIEEMTAALSRGETLKLHEFGSFLVRTKGERSGRNPRTGARVPIEPRKVVVFKASPNMKAAINGDAIVRGRPVLRITRKAEG